MVEQDPDDQPDAQAEIARLRDESDQLRARCAALRAIAASYVFHRPEIATVADAYALVDSIAAEAVTEAER